MVPRRLKFPAERSAGSQVSRVRYHGVRWLLLVFVATVTYAMFPAPASGPGQVPAIGAVAPRDVIAPVPYVVPKSPEQLELRSRLGKHRMGKSCLYLKRLADLDVGVLEAIIAGSVADVRRRYPRPGDA